MFKRWAKNYFFLATLNFNILLLLVTRLFLISCKTFADFSLSKGAPREFLTTRRTFSDPTIIISQLPACNIILKTFREQMNKEESMKTLWDILMYWLSGEWSHIYLTSLFCLKKSLVLLLSGIIWVFCPLLVSHFYFW